MTTPLRAAALVIRCSRLRESELRSSRKKPPEMKKMSLRPGSLFADLIRLSSPMSVLVATVPLCWANARARTFTSDSALSRVIPGLRRIVAVTKKSVRSWS